MPIPSSALPLERSARARRADPARGDARLCARTALLLMQHGASALVENMVRRLGPKTKCL